MSYDPNYRPYDPPPVNPNSFSNGGSQGPSGSGYGNGVDPYNGQSYGQGSGQPYGQSYGLGSQYPMAQAGPVMSGPMTYGAPMMMRPQTNHLSTWSMWLGIVGLGGGFVCNLLSVIPIIGYLFMVVSLFLWIAPILAIIFGHIAHRQIRRTGENGHGQATAGLVLGYINLALIVLMVVIVVGFVGLGFLAMGKSS